MLRILLAIALFFFAALPARADAPPLRPLAAKAWVLLDFQSGQFFVGQEADARVEPASLTKLMSAYVVFDALKKGQLRANQTVPVSVNAWKTQGSRMFIEPRKPVTVDELLHGMIVQSGNDATIALAEAVAGSEEVFAGLMNREAQRMGLRNTNFVNATGLPDDRHYSSARDLALLAAALIRDFPQEYKIYSTREYRYNNITQPNRNRLLWLDPHVDGVKTGHTDSAGYCLIASAKRGERRLISVVLGAGSESGRAQESQKLLNYGFQFYDSVLVYRKGAAISNLKVWKGAEEQVQAGVPRDLFLTLPQGDSKRLKAELVSQQPLIAPVAAGQKVGIVRILLDGKTLGEYEVVANEAVPVAGFFGRIADTIALWFK